MRTSLVVGASIALAVVALDMHFAMEIPMSPTVSLSVAQASQSLSVSGSTTTLSAADASLWSVSSVGEMQNVSAGAQDTVMRIAASDSSGPGQFAAPPAEIPSSLLIPSIELRSPVIPVGVNKKGEMDVPDGSTNNVGWYQGGPKPGQVGTAVLDAHVFAAFEDLRYVKVGDEIIVQTESGVRLRFVVERSTVYKLSELTPQLLFGSDGERRLNLITCAGSPVGDTYSHRLVVYTKFVEVI